jgi:hypothetical protein
MIIEGNDYTTKYTKLANGFRCEITGHNHMDRGNGKGLLKGEAFDTAFADYRTNRKTREDEFVDKMKEKITNEPG